MERMTNQRKFPGTKMSLMLGDRLESGAGAFEKASVSSVESTKRTARTIELAVASGLHKAAYGVSYGVVYAGSFLAELLPKENVVRRGFVEGAEAALDARKKAYPARRIPEKSAAAHSSTKIGPQVRISPRAKKVLQRPADDFEAAAARAKEGG
jgi:hypothetical protein